MAPRVLQGVAAVGDSRQLGAFLTRLAGFFDAPIADARFTVGAEDTGTNTVRFTLQVVDRLGRAWSGQRWICLLYLSTTADGAPGGTQAVTVTAGTVIKALTADQAWAMATDATGKVVLDVVISGAASRYLQGCVLLPLQVSAAASWT